MNHFVAIIALKSHLFSRAKTSLLLAFLCLSLVDGHGQIEAVVVDQNLSKLNVSTMVGIYVERDKELSYNEVTQLSDDNFVHTERRNVYQHYGVNPCWFKLKLQSNRDISSQVILQLANPKLSKVELYHVHAGELRIAKSGEYYPFEIREIQDRFSSFYIDLEPGKQKEVYFRIDNARNYIDVPVVVWKPVEYLNFSYRSQFTIALYYGVVILLTAVIIWLFVLTRSRMILMYLLYAVSLSLIQFVRDGFGVEFVWNGIPGFNHTVVSIAVALSIICGTRFGMMYLRTREILPRYHKYLQVFIYVGIADVVLALIPATSLFVLEYNKVLVLLSILSLLVAGALAIRKNPIAARFYLAGYLTLFLGIVIVLMLIEGLIYSEFLEAYALKIASAAEILILTFAMVHHVREQQKVTQSLAFQRLSEINKLTQKSNRELTERIQLNEQLRQSELRALHAQMNPHFIFNALNSVQFYILNKDHEKAVRYLTRFSKLMRSTLDHARETTISIEDEMETIRLYLELEAMRFDREFVYTIHIDDNLDVHHKIPPMLIQPYVENAIWHGIMNKDQGIGEVGIRLTHKDSHIECVIEDNGVGREAAKAFRKRNKVEHRSAGMLITQKRIELLHSDNVSTYEYEIKDLVDPSGEPVGTKVRFTLPL